MMASSEKSYSGACLCGAVKFTLTPQQENFGVCHCSTCRKWASGPFFAVGCGSAIEFEPSEHLKTYASSDWAERGFCGQCGTSLFYRLKDSGSYQVAMGTIDGVDEFVFSSQIFIDEKPKSYSFANDNRQLTGKQVIDAYLAGKTGGAADNG